MNNHAKNVHPPLNEPNPAIIESMTKSIGNLPEMLNCMSCIHFCILDEYIDWSKY
jgi:hypothetical protein